MNKFFVFGCFTGLLSATFAAQAIDAASLIEVTNENNPQCIEFYTYNKKLYCSTNPTNESSIIDPRIKDYETQILAFDQRPWQAVWGKKTDEITTVEYVPASNNINQWKELVTSQFIPGLQNKITPKQYADAMLQQLKDSNFKPIIKFIKETPNQVIFEFRISSPDKFKQDELQVVNKGSDGFYIVHYVIKEADMGDANRDKWLNNMQKTSVKPKQ